MWEGGRSTKITASEIGEFVYCAKAWRLKRSGAEAQSESLGDGITFHRKHGVGVSLANRLERVGKSLLLAAALLLLLRILIIYLSGGEG
ncbi:MAG: hypothetical protein J2P41_02645 [Blastocatellia bacterium]|nr:hypothetical protein [Blastocatellia bacterium]